VNSYRFQIVTSTVLLVSAVMTAVVLGTQLVLELGESDPAARSAWNVLLDSGLVGACGVVLSGWVAWRVSHRVAQAIRAEQRFSAELAHEIRTPLTAIRGSAELALLRERADPGLRTDLTEIADGTRRLAEVVATLLELAQNPGEAVRATASPDAVIAQVAGLVPARIELELTGSAPPIAGPLALVTRALAPLVENAGQHAARRVTLHLRARDLVEIAVSDDGPGVPPELRESIFEPGTSTQGSSGLGLGIARRVARSLGGDVVLHGDEFVLRLPSAR
jgi:signal transduction histidine kinase